MEPQAYISTYGLYNNGYISGRWFAASELYDGNAVMAEIRRLAVKDGIPESEVDDFMGDEIMVQDTDGYPFDIRTDDLNTLAEIGEAIEDDDELTLRIALLEASHGTYGMGYAEIIEAARDLCFTEGRDIEDCAAELCENMGVLDEMPKHLRPYFDYAAYARDLRYEGFAEVQHDGTTYLVHP
jgi:antirestriction protein